MRQKIDGTLKIGDKICIPWRMSPPPNELLPEKGKFVWIRNVRTNNPPESYYIFKVSKNKRCEK